MSRPLDLAGTKKGRFLKRTMCESRHAPRAQSHLHRYSTNPSTTYRSSGCEVTHVCRVHRHLSVLTHSTLTSTLCATSFKQLHAQEVLDDSSFCETFFQFTTLSHHAERKDAVLEVGEGSEFIKPDDGGDEMFCHVRDPKHGEGEVDEGNIARPKSCEPQARPAAAWCMMARR